MPELILRVAAGSVGAAHDVVVTAEPSHTVAEVTVALAAHLGWRGEASLASARLGRLLDPGSPLGDVDLLTGDELVLGAAPSERTTKGRTDPGSDVAVDLVAGPEAGRSHLVRRPGRYLVGRAHDATVRVGDPSVSRRHATIELDRSGGATVHPHPGSANGVLLNGTEITAPATVHSSDVVTLGGTRLAVRPVPTRIDDRCARFGRIDFHRTPYRPPVVADHATEPVGPIPDRPDPRRLPTIAIVAPLVAGAVMYAVTRQLHFLALTLLSPVVMIGTAVEDRRSGRRAHRERLARFRRALADHRHHFEQLRESERIERFRAAPDLADLIRRAELRTTDLWARGRAAPDFLTVRLGVGPAPVGFAIELERGGADDLRDEAAAAFDGLDRLAEVPVTITLDAVFAIQGQTALADGVAAALVVQAATLHSPEDVTIAGAVRPSLGWLRWLPHARSVTSPLPGDHVACTASDAAKLLDRLLEVAERRVGAVDHGAGAPAFPRLLVVLDAALAPDPARVARLLDLAPAAGLAVVWVATSADRVPRQADRTLVVGRRSAGIVRGRLWSTDPDIAEVDIELDHVRSDHAERAARALAPLRDASTMSIATAIPRVLPLLDVLGVGRPSAAWVIEQWQHRRSDGLRFEIGVGVDGPVELDLVADGPHTLVGGTSGAGKSELLQSMVASLAVHHPPTRLNLLFVDYKGGASSQVFDRLPHTVGLVTNLSAELAARALTSLRAELHRRMALLEGRAKDLSELLAIAPDEAPPSLVIVVDEFATLVREVPEFVTGVVDIAQRGRSLGIHLVLATQRPTGSVNDNILANTNLRISLRMLDRAESTAVVGVPDAADIPVPLRGRGIVRLGPRRLVEFQAAFAGAPLLAREVRPPVIVTAFGSTDGSPIAGTGTAISGTPTTGTPTSGTPTSSTPAAGTQLTAVLDAIAEADRRLGLPPARRPWREPLPATIELDAVLADPGAERAFALPGRFVAIGMLDAPERQSQHAAIIDLEDGGGLLVFGSGGVGVTTVLRTLAASVSATAAAGEVAVAIVVFDAGGRGCGALTALPAVVDVVPGDDLEAVTRHLLVLERELDRRRALVGSPVGGRAVESRILVLIDGFGGLTGALLDRGVAGDVWVDRIVRLVVEGRQVGIHTVITADRRGSVPARVHAAVANRIVLRHADDAAYAEHGLAAARARGLVPGRGFVHSAALVEPALVQIASVSTDPAAGPQEMALAELGEQLRSSRSRHVPERLASTPLPERDAIRPTPPGGLQAIIGRADVTGDPVGVDLEWSHLAVCGPARSGRSNALAAVVSQLVAGGGVPEILVAGPASSPLRACAGWSGVRAAFGREIGSLLDELPVADGAPRVVVVDDLDALDDLALTPAFDRLARDETTRLVVAMEPRTGFTVNPLVTLARRARRLLVLQPDDPAEFLQLTGCRLALRPGLRLPPGRGVLLVDRVPTLLQVTDMSRPADDELAAAARHAGAAP